ncbi:ABC-F family ATP-binding cassette domain-containing protein [Spirochaeta cellobiosiphila]|uniref:ABC-F family ATP-binding cassette domain-containing protein n=1 Tax=Spirochaeta cellobiosiphila TaxID=504483 RepID=UPI0003FFE89E|nr:ATP-binding cassette domain-containing protein [Spirochaeta cellobiosiphila]
MITVSNVTLSFGERTLFKDVNIKFTPGNCYGLIGANGAGKSTFLKVLSGVIPSDEGDIFIDKNQRMAVLEQDQFKFDNSQVLHTVIMGHKKLYDIMMEKDAIYEKEDFTEEDGMRASELEGEFAELGGWEAEAEASALLAGLGIGDDFHEKLMKDLEGGEKVRVLLAQALFGNPDILLLDEPTNHLDIESIKWLEDFLSRFSNTVIVVSHDRHFLNQVCTHIADIDYAAVNLYVGNYDFWYEASQLVSKQKRDEKRKTEEKAAELKAFIQRFASNASKAKQATSRKKQLDKLDLTDLPHSSRRFPYIAFKPERECGRSVLSVKGLDLEVDGVKYFDNYDFQLEQGDKVAFLGDGNIKTAFFDVISGEVVPQNGDIEWGVTISHSYLPKENSKYFSEDINLIDWLRQFSEEQDETYIRGFLGRMLFSGEDALKKVTVLSGGEKVRCMLSKTMLANSNVLILDEPTNHLDLESITSLNNGLIDFKEVLLFTSHDHQFIETVANRIVEFTPSGIIDRRMKFEEYLSNKDVTELRHEYYKGHQRLSL